MIVTRLHMRTIKGYGKKTGFCAEGGRQWFARYGLDWSDFVKNGIAAERLLATGDALAAALVEHAKQEEASKYGQQ